MQLPSSLALSLLFLWPGAAPGSTALELEALDGSVTRLTPGDLPLSDPRERGGYLVRPLDASRAAPPTRAGSLAELELADGDRLVGTLAGGEGEVLELEILGGVRLPIGISELASFVVPDLLPARLAEPLTVPAEGDRLYRRTGDSLDRIDGAVEGFTSEGVRFDSLLGSKTFAWSEVAALFVEDLDGDGDGDGDGEAHERSGVPVVVDLTDGSRLRGRLESLDASACNLRIGGERITRLVWEHVAEVVVDDGQLAFLSDLAPVEETGRGIPFGDELGMSWPMHADRSVLGAPLRAGGRTYTRGIGTHAPTRVLWRVDPRFDELRGAVAIDDSSATNAAEARGSVVFRLSVDGELLWESPLVRGGDPPRAIPTLTLPAGDAAHELELEVDPAGDFRGDRADWLRMVLVDRR